MLEISSQKLASISREKTRLVGVCDVEREGGGWRNKREITLEKKEEGEEKKRNYTRKKVENQRREMWTQGADPGGSVVQICVGNTSRGSST